MEHYKTGRRPKTRSVEAHKTELPASEAPNHTDFHNEDSSNSSEIPAKTQMLGFSEARVLERVLECEMLRLFQSERRNS